MKTNNRLPKESVQDKLDTSMTPVVGIDYIGDPISGLSGTFITGVCIPNPASFVLNIGAVTAHGFIHGVVDSSESKFYPGRIFADKTRALSFIPGLDFKGRFVPGAVRGTTFVPGVYYTGAFIPGIYRDELLVPGTVEPDGFKELPDSSDVGMMLRFGNPFNWDLSESYTSLDTPPDLIPPEPDETGEEAAKERIRTRYQIPVGFGNGSRPPAGAGWDGPRLPGHGESIASERERSKFEALDFDKDGKPDIGWRVLDPRMSPSEPGESGEVIFGSEEDDVDLLGGIGIGMGSSGGRIRLPKLTGNPEEDMKRILGGIDPNKRGRISLIDPDGPSAVVDKFLVFLICLAVKALVEIILEEPPHPDPESPHE